MVQYEKQGKLWTASGTKNCAENVYCDDVMKLIQFLKHKISLQQVNRHSTILLYNCTFQLEA